MPPILNIAAYLFADLTDLPRLRQEIRQAAVDQQLLGTVLLSPEGINLFLAGEPQGIAAFLTFVRQIPGLAELQAKESWSEERPFHRLLVKIKKEIIAFGRPGIEPARYTSKRVSARELKAWLDAGRPVTLLDTRNQFEVEAGTFQNAVAIDIDDFRHFPEAVGRLPEEMKQQPVVTFCTGGIRCEKAAPFLEAAGFRDVYQLDGGILKYFEDCGGAHYDGTCFVFDQRVALNPDLQVSSLQQCFACQAILTPEDQQSPHYIVGQSCPRCYQPEAAAEAELLARRQEQLWQATTPLPGSVPYENVRPISVPLRYDGMEVVAFLDALQTRVSRKDWETALAAGRLTCRGEIVRPGRIMRSGERLLHTTPAAAEPAVAADIRLLYEDEALLVVHKPAPLPMHPCGRFHRNSLSYLLEQVYQPLVPRPAHRLDADTSGVVVFTKSRAMARRLQPQFERGEVRKTYLARVRGLPAQSDWECHLPIAAEPGPEGLRLPAPDGQAAQTRFHVRTTFADGTTLLEVTPLTGRTNQIRVHLWSAGLPIVGDRAYLPGQKLGTNASRSLTDPPLCLHAATLEFRHPQTQEWRRFQAAAPDWCEEVSTSRRDGDQP